jgi:hypothetical protein
MSWQDLVVILLAAASLAWLARFSYCASLRNGSGCSSCPKCRARKEPRRLIEISTPRNDVDSSDV